MEAQRSGFTYSIIHSRNVYQEPKAVVVTSLQERSGDTLGHLGIPADAEKYQDIPKPGTHTNSFSCTPTHKVMGIYYLCSPTVSHLHKPPVILRKEVLLWLGIPYLPFTPPSWSPVGSLF